MLCGTLIGIRADLQRHLGGAVPDVLVSISDELRAWAREQGVNMSGTMRDALQAERDRRAAVDATLDKAGEHDVLVIGGEWAGDNGAYTARIHGTEIAGTTDVQVYLCEDGSLVVYHSASLTLHLNVDQEALESWLDGSPKQYMRAMRALGEEPVIHIGRATA
jgi:post-segregation antitoxin (ccd killing protein)